MREVKFKAVSIQPLFRWNDYINIPVRCCNPWFQYNHCFGGTEVKSM